MSELKNLLQTKKVIALMMTIVFSVLAIKGTVTAQDFIPVFSIVIGYYFGQSTVTGAMYTEKNTRERGE